MTNSNKLNIFIALLFLTLWQIGSSEVYGMFQGFQPTIFQTEEKDKFIKTVFTTDEGLPQNSVTSIVQTKDGYIWAATFGGLSRFDGIKFTNFIPTNTDGLVSNRLTCLYEDRNGVLWIGSEDGDLTTYQNGEFSLIKQSEGPPQDSTIVSLMLDRNNILWIGSSTGLKTYDVEKKVFKSYKTEEYLKKFPTAQSLRTDIFKGALRINGFKEDANGTIWIGSTAGLIKFQDGQFTNFVNSDGFPDESVNSIQTDERGNLFILTEVKLGQVENNSFALSKDFQSNASRTFVKNSEINNNPSQNLFLFGGTKHYESSNDGLKEFELSDSLKSNLRCGLIDKEGNLWLGTDTELILLKKRNISLFSVSDNNSWRSVQAIIEMPDKTVWASSRKDLLKWENGKFEIVSSTLGTEVRSQGRDITSMGFDHKGVLWIGSYNGIVSLKDGNFNKFEPEGLMIKEPASILFEKDGSMWIGGKSRGLQHYRNGRFTNYKVENGLVSNSTSYLMQDSKGVLWIGTKGGLSRFENGTFTNFTTENGLTNNNVRDIYEDVDGTFWIGTYGGGMLRYRDGKFVSITSKDGLSENIASRILVDNNNHFWILGNQGVYSVSRAILNDFADGKIKRVYCTVYGIKDGMATAEGNGGNQYAGWKTSDGKLWFPMIRGGVIIDPIINKSSPPPVFIENLTLDDKLVEANNFLQIQPGQDNLQINYTALEFNKPEQLQFRYKLLNYDDDWQEVGTRRTAYYTQLPPGKYTFMVQAVSSDGAVSQKDATFEIEVVAPFWKTNWFYLLCVLAIIGVIILIYQRRLWIAKRRQFRREEFSRKLINAHESERQRIASELHDGLGQDLLIIKNWTHLCLLKITPNSEIKAELTDILDTSSNALNEMRNIARNLRPQNLQRLGLTETLKFMVKQVEDSSGIKFTTEIEDIDNLFSEDEELSIYRIVQESLNNIIKHSQATKAGVQVKRQHSRVHITNSQDKVELIINDNGKGFDFQTAKKVSFGLDNIIQRVELLNGTLSIDSTPDAGTQITVYLIIKGRVQIR